MHNVYATFQISTEKFFRKGTHTEKQQKERSREARI